MSVSNREPPHAFGEVGGCEQPRGSVLMSSEDYREEHEELLRLRAQLTPERIAHVAESVWRMVIAFELHEGFRLHDGCELDDQSDCALFNLIAEEIAKEIK